MRRGQQHSRRTEGVRAALKTPVNEQADSDTYTTLAQWAPMVRRLQAIGPWAATVAAIVLLGTFMLMLVDTGRIHAGAPRAIAQPTPTATPTPTPTPTPSPTALPLPTPMVGNKLYADVDEGFYLQYPQEWSTLPHGSSWIEITDNPKAERYDLQVLVPSGWNGCNQGKTTDQASAWVDCVLTGGAASGQLPGTFKRTTGNLPPETIGGASWQTGEGVELIGTTSFRVRVYATVRGSKPYIIILTAEDDQFDQGQRQYFTPILNTFTFLTPAP